MVKDRAEKRSRLSHQYGYEGRISIFPNRQVCALGRLLARSKGRERRATYGGTSERAGGESHRPSAFSGHVRMGSTARNRPNFAPAQLYKCVLTGASGLQNDTTNLETARMEDTPFKNLSRIEVCRKMSAICQKSADETRPGAERERLRAAANKFSDEADALANGKTPQGAHAGPPQEGQQV
jgi:hypothetical protein